MIIKELIAALCEIIKNNSGLCISGAHLDFLTNYLIRRLQVLGISENEYLSLVKQDDVELRSLINEAAINETYFFREEKQFAFLETTIFPKFTNSRCIIWSAACSTGEEPLSILSLASKCNLLIKLIASDIDTKALELFKKGEYSAVSFRKDGSSFHELLSNFYISEENNKKQIKPEIINSININDFNLVTQKGSLVLPLDNSVSIIFLRNVLIYFDKVTRDNILLFMEKKLEVGGYLFCSSSEIASLEIPKNCSLKKEKMGNLYFFKKENKNIEVLIKKINRKNTISTTTSQIVHNENTIKKTTHEKKISCIDPVVFYSEFLNYLNLSLFDQAQIMLVEKHFSLSNKYLYYYFSGAFYQAKKQIEEAKKNYEKSVLLNPSFWISHLMCGILYYPDEKKIAKKYFVKTATLLEKYIEQKDSKYDYLIESFSAEYFYDLCQKYISMEIM